MPEAVDLFGDGAAEDGSATNGRLWRTVIIGEQEHRIDLQMIKPYMRVVAAEAIMERGLSMPSSILAALLSIRQQPARLQVHHGESLLSLVAALHLCGIASSLS
uniref:Uncharacterized protein n=1 Tax=Sphaerodactylus townsendi TaxID=933632 RepID=A0ACB8F120_9SAUR